MRIRRAGVGMVGGAATCTVEFGLGSGVSPLGERWLSTCWNGVCLCSGASGRCCETKCDGSACIFHIMAEN